jgi:hypothetical protein
MSRKAQSKHEFFHRGVDNQKTPDIIIDMRRPSKEQMKLWPLRSKIGLRAWLSDIDRSYKAFRKEIMNATK